jgi:DNA mismatch endonuclease (patch repair protein)
MIRLHRRDLPGTPDIVLPRSKKIINIHGCFWHGHSCQRRRKSPVIHADYWQAKQKRNVARDRRTRLQLRRLGWEVLTIWECQTRDMPALTPRVAAFLSRGPQRIQARLGQ